MAERLPRITAADLISALERGGWARIRQRGSHVRLAHANRPMRVTVSIHAGQVVRPGTLRSVLDQAGLTVDELIELL
ncbi:MAG: addiction module toxin, HicA family [Chloroflexi bacterium]|nr:addiction module toxin, HicA family [Chloroflexota bacterium]